MKRHEIVTKLARRLANPKRANYMGNNAALRRMNLAEPGYAAVIALSALVEEAPELDLERIPAEHIDCWLLTMHMLALARWRHDRAHSLGEGLVAMMLSQNRLKQLLSADYDVLCELLPRITRRFATVTSPAAMDFMPLIELIFAARANAEQLHQVRLKIARSYTLAEYRQTQQSPIQSRNAS